MQDEGRDDESSPGRVCSVRRVLPWPQSPFGNRVHVKIGSRVDDDEFLIYRETLEGMLAERGFVCVRWSNFQHLIRDALEVPEAAKQWAHRRVEVRSDEWAAVSLYVAAVFVKKS